MKDQVYREKEGVLVVTKDNFIFQKKKVSTLEYHAPPKHEQILASACSTAKRSLCSSHPAYESTIYRQPTHTVANSVLLLRSVWQIQNASAIGLSKLHTTNALTGQEPGDQPANCRDHHQKPSAHQADGVSSSEKEARHPALFVTPPHDEGEPQHSVM